MEDPTRTIKNNRKQLINIIHLISEGREKEGERIELLPLVILTTQLNERFSILFEKL